MTDRAEIDVTESDVADAVERCLRESSHPPTIRSGPTLDERLARHGIADAVAALCDLLDSQAHRDRDGEPGWKQVPAQSHADHCEDHAFVLADSQTALEDTGFETSLHVAARALFVWGTVER